MPNERIMFTTAYLSEREQFKSENCHFQKCIEGNSQKVITKVKKKILPEYQKTSCGFSIPKQFSLEAFNSALSYEPRPDDLFITTYPKCGATWVQNIVACIHQEGSPFSSALEFFNNAPFLEMSGAEAARIMKRPGAIKTHLPIDVIPWFSQAKYIYVARNPKDCCVSFYHHTKNFTGYKFKNGSFDDYFELFMKGEVDYGDYFDSLISWYERRNDPNVLFITYEQLKEDIKRNVLKIANFMGSEYKEMLEKNETMLKDVIKHSSFEFMKETLNQQISELARQTRKSDQDRTDLSVGLKKLLESEESFFDTDPNSISYVRKGIVGDWKNHFSPEQDKTLEKKFMERTKGTDIQYLWQDIFKTSSTE
nr:sulfotransferase 1E1 isoform X2 [Parasteatoda tepidariorum]